MLAAHLCGEILAVHAGTSIMVDGFLFVNDKCRSYVLTHYHSDHTIGLRRSFDAGVIYASPITTALLIHDFGLPPHVVIPLPLGQRTVIEGVGVTLLDANHCPGAAMALFEVPQPDGSLQNVLHTGDCRCALRQPVLGVQALLFSSVSSVQALRLCSLPAGSAMSNAGRGYAGGRIGWRSSLA
jgi:DNA cross-link repair 1A protein